MQEILVLGNVGKDAEIKNFNGKNLTIFSVGCNESYTNSEGVKVEKSTWFDVLYQNEKLAQYIKKGNKILVRGTPRITTYKNKDGVFCASISISANKVELLSPKDKTQSDAVTSETKSGDDLPF